MLEACRLQIVEANEVLQRTLGLTRVRCVIESRSGNSEMIEWLDTASILQASNYESHYLQLQDDIALCGRCSTSDDDRCLTSSNSATVGMIYISMIYL